MAEGVILIVVMNRGTATEKPLLFIRLRKINTPSQTSNSSRSAGMPEVYWLLCNP